MNTLGKILNLLHKINQENNKKIDEVNFKDLEHIIKQACLAFKKYDLLLVDFEKNRVFSKEKIEELIGHFYSDSMGLADCINRLDELVCELQLSIEIGVPSFKIAKSDHYYAHLSCDFCNVFNRVLIICRGINSNSIVHEKFSGAVFKKQEGQIKEFQRKLQECLIVLDDFENKTHQRDSVDKFLLVVHAYLIEFSEYIYEFDALLVDLLRKIPDSKE